MRHPNPALDRFIDGLEGIVGRERDQWKIVEPVQALMQQLITSPDRGWLKDKYRRPPEGKAGVASGYGQYCLYRRGTALSVIAFCWGAGKGTPIHDHLSWGVLGFVDGLEQETRYKRIDDGQDPKRAQLKEAGVYYTRTGETSHVVSPQRDVHRVHNPGDSPSVSVHVYGCDMGRQRRRRYDLETGAIEWYSTPHDSDEVVVS
ncbi:MAG TPA: cysteine dioxygenase family protein [Burkholderiales bacterium]|jgi:predicted metal-dependent enzyme (double-stranded beta helix superfamily)|nr:cysteine dioxygenase family protein [Burkholderiales bacterium]HXR59280.1 cysteine dioxygenase family protein [Burkholderiales bacterium]